MSVGISPRCTYLRFDEHISLRPGSLEAVILLTGRENTGTTGFNAACRDLAARVRGHGVGAGDPAGADAHRCAVRLSADLQEIGLSGPGSAFHVPKRLLACLAMTAHCTHLAAPDLDDGTGRSGG